MIHLQDVTRTLLKMLMEIFLVKMISNFGLQGDYGGPRVPAGPKEEPPVTCCVARPSSTRATLWAKLREHSVSSRQEALGERFTSITVFAEPERESWSRNVSLERRYGTCPFLLPRADITSESARRETLILMASSFLAPAAPDLEMRSLPARSTMWSLLRVSRPVFGSVQRIRTVVSRWLRLLQAFMIVCAVERRRAARSSISIVSWALRTSAITSPGAHGIPDSGSSFTSS